MPDNVILTIQGQRYDGWTAARVVRSIENITSTFAVSVSERDPGLDAAKAVKPEDECVLSFDDDEIIRGYVDAVTVGYDAGSHSVEVRGRDMTGQLVDCSVANRPGEWHDARLEDIVAQLCEPFGIRVTRYRIDRRAVRAVPRGGRRDRVRGHRPGRAHPGSAAVGRWRRRNRVGPAGADARGRCGLSAA